MKPTDVFAAGVQVATYPDRPPFSPSTAYPEYHLGDLSQEPNEVYEAVRRVLQLSGLDRQNFGTPHWNPLREFIDEGQTVLLKPNLVKEFHPRYPHGWQWVLTHGSVIRAVADYCFAAVGQSGRVVIADAPQTDSSFSAVVDRLGLREVSGFLASKGCVLELLDLRQEEWTNRDGVIVSRRKLPGDPRGSIRFDLADRSEFVGHRGEGRYYGADYDSDELNSHHTGGKHEYLIAASVTAADVIISIPKLKTHKKAGITVSLKNLVGVNADKNWLPHHTEGTPSTGGDERPDAARGAVVERSVAGRLRNWVVGGSRASILTMKIARRVGSQIFGATENVIRSGNWHGNDTIWRTCLDLNKIVLYGTKDGALKPAKVEEQRTHLVFVDGIIAGEGNGPMDPDPVASGLVVFGSHPTSVDAACAALMGFDPRQIPIVREAFACEAMPLCDWRIQDVRLRTSESAGQESLDEVRANVPHRFKPHFGWRDALGSVGP